MMDLDSKRQRRKENKKRKIAAFLAVAELNDVQKDSAKKQKTTGSESSRPKAEDENENLKSNIISPPELVTKYTTNAFKAVSDKPQLEGEEYEDLRRRLRERKKALSCIPLFRLKAVGQEAAVDREKRVPLFMTDIQHLLLFCMVGDRAPYQPYRWCTMSKWNRLSNMVMLVLEGVGMENYTSYEKSAAWMRKHIPDMVEVISPSSYHSSVVEELSMLPLTVMHKEKLIKKFGSLESALEKDEAFKAFRSIFPVKFESKTKSSSLKLSLLLSATQMVTDNYPMPLSGSLGEKYAGYLYTSDQYSEVTEDSPLYSLDCEMCLTSAGHELTRICVVDTRLAVVYHTLVKPRNTITNYLTQYSGITPDMLEEVTTRLEDVQEALRSLLPPDAILVGQSLNFDLVALKVFHPYVIDTSVCFNITGDRRRKTKLSVLTQLFLNKTIQTAGKEGHNPIEDAQAAMDLVNLKLEKGLQFGDAVMGGEVPSLTEEGRYKVTQSRLDKSESLMTSLSKTLSQHDKTVSVVCDQQLADKYEAFPGFKSALTSFKSAASNSEAVEAAAVSAVEHNLTICHVGLQGEDRERDDKKIKKFTKKLFSHTSLNGMFIVLLAGTNSQNSVAGILVKRPSDES